MSKLKILHAADFHLDSPFEGLSSGLASVRRNEQRDLLRRITQIAAEESVDLVFFCGDLLDSDNAYYETGETLTQCLRAISVPTFISPGNHDFISPQSPYLRLKLPENTHVFTSDVITHVDLPELNARIYGAAFTDRRCKPLLKDFHVSDSDRINLLCMHGEVTSGTSIYNPVTVQQLETSGLDYAAFGHIHKPSGLLRAGKTCYSWPGCPEGRGFDELGPHYINIVECSDDDVWSVRSVETSSRKYEILSVDITDADPLLAIHKALPDDIERDLYRIVLTGTAPAAPDLNRLQRNLEELFFCLQIKDCSHLMADIWEHCGEDTLRGLFLSKMKALYDRASGTDQEILEQAVRWGLAALDNREEVASCEDQ